MHHSRLSLKPTSRGGKEFNRKLEERYFIILSNLQKIGYAQSLFLVFTVGIIVQIAKLDQKKPH